MACDPPLPLLPKVYLGTETYLTLASATGSSKKPSGKASDVLGFGGCLGFGGFSL